MRWWWIRWGGEQAKIFHLENEQFVEISLPTEYEGLGNLFKIGYWDDTFWAIGAAGSLISIEDNVATAIPTGLSIDSDNDSSRSNRRWKRRRIATTLDDDGLSEPVQIPAGLNGVFQYEVGHSIVVGERGYGALYDVNTQEYQELPSITLDVLHAVWVTQQGDAYAVGGNLFTSEEYFHGVILKLEGVQ